MTTKHLKNWWFLSLNGLVFIAFGLLLLFYIPEEIKPLIKYFGILVLLFGIIFLVLGINNFRKNKKVFMILIQSISTLGIGIVLTFFPELSVKLFIILLGIWMAITGIIQLVMVANLAISPLNKNGLLINGLLTLGLGVALFFDPFSWAIFLIKLIGVLASLFGLLLIYFSFIVKVDSVTNQSSSESAKSA
ncbi:MAG: DUF308 domain-containing protein [Bacteroidales bacterium]|nr:DUF308 domain-containing protein [Bacteroidales bacterium]MDD4602427.1 DUF308 domain-containing protein [Bacteroidales bacterium]